MKPIYAMLLPVLLVGAGCVTFPSLKEEAATKTNPTAPPAVNASVPAARQEPALPPVNPDEVNDSNAREKAEALRRELSREDK
jgi:hypothetical protein